MKISVSALTTERKWRSATGLTSPKFAQLLIHFKRSYQLLFGADMTTRGLFTPYQVAIQTEEELLFFTLFSFKAGLTYDLLGLVCGMDGSNAKRNQELGIQVLLETLTAAGYAPKREFANVAEFEAYFSAHETLLIDGTEQRTQRPSEKEAQKAQYSGKKKRILQKR